MMLCLTGTAIAAVPVSAAAQTADGSGARGPALDEIVVTATKRNENLVDVPITITTVSEQDIAKRNAVKVADLITVLPNVSLLEGGQTESNPIIRGIASNTRNAGVESGVSVYIDGVYTGRPETFNQNLEDVRSIEVLQGPQGTLFGKNSIAGAINVNTNDPAFEWSGSAKVTVGNFDTLDLNAIVNAPIVDEHVAFRASLFSNERDGYVKNALGGPDLGSRDIWGGRAKLLFQGESSLRAVLSFDYSDEDSVYYVGEPRSGLAQTVAPPQPLTSPGPFTIDEDPGRYAQTYWGTSLAVSVGDPSGFELTSISAFRYNRSLLEFGQDWTPAERILISFRDKQTQFSQEIRLASPKSDTANFIAGLYFYEQQSDSAHIGIIGRDFSVPPLGIFPGPRGFATPLADVRTRSFAAYIDGSINITPRLSIFGGVRVTNEEKKLDFQVTTDARSSPLFYTIPLQKDKRRQTDLSPTFGVKYELGSSANIYAKVSRGYKSGGWNVDFVGRSAAPPPTVQQLRFEPENVTNYEIGLKGSFFDRRVRVGVSAFHMDYSNLQVTQFFGFNGGSVTSNAASAKIDGVSLDVTAKLTDTTTVGAVFGYNDARYHRYPGAGAAGEAADGNRLNGPSTTAGANISQDILFGGGNRISLFGEVSYRGSGYNEPLNIARLKLPARTLVNASITFEPESERYSVGLFARNLLNNTYLAKLVNDPFAVGPGEVAQYGLPRTFGVSASVRF
ncbi:iron complex outermembrane receptor protein [Sphingopyxis sp. OAS728]|nr:iron complex outermembrane receptor protein [Sphingopyxis sp. OAS728]